MSEQRPDQLSKWQQEAMSVPEAFDLFLGGSRGSGKTHLLCALFLRHCEQHGERARCLVVRKSFPGLMDLEAEMKAFFGAVYGTALKFDGQKHRFTMPNGATVALDQLEREADFQKYQGKSFSHIAVDEAGQYSSPALIDRLRSSLRAPAGVPTRFIMAANPGGAGHAWLVRRHALKASWQPYTDAASGFDFVTINATYLDNEFINRERYAKNLIASCATDPELGRAWLLGDWSILRGAYFSSVIDENRNMIEPWAKLPYEEPEDPWSDQQTSWEYYLAHDYGSAAPSVTYLVARSPGAEALDGFFYPRGSLILVDEETTTHPDDLNQGMNLTVQEQADRIKRMCQRWGVPARGVADDAIFNKTGSQSGSIADEFRKAGVNFRRARKGSRIGGWEIMRRLLADAGKPDMPGLYISRKCHVWWQTVPALPRCTRNPEDVDSTAADHAADACRYGCIGNNGAFRVPIKFAY